MPASAAGSNAAVQAAVALGGMTTEQAADPDTPLTRGQLARLLTAFSSYRENVAAQGSSGTLFSDVNGASAYGPYIRVVVQQSWLSGYLDGSFRPDNTVTLEEACTAVLKLLGYDVTALSSTFPPHSSTRLPLWACAAASPPRRAASSHWPRAHSRSTTL